MRGKNGDQSIAGNLKETKSVLVTLSDLFLLAGRKRSLFIPSYLYTWPIGLEGVKVESCKDKRETKGVCG